MIRYFTRGPATATTETRRTAQRLTRKGWRRCTPAQHRQTWQARDAARRMEQDIMPPGWAAAQGVAVPVIREVG